MNLPRSPKWNATPGRVFLFITALVTSVLAAEDTGTSAHTRELLKARLAEDAAKAAAVAKLAPATPAAVLPKNDEASPAPKPAPAPPAPPAVLPKVEVSRGRVTEFGRQLHEQDLEIVREKQLTKPSDLDKALNDPKTSKLLTILGGQSGALRANLAKERVALLEEERDLIEEIARTKSKEGKQALQKQLAEIRVMRRELEQAPR